MRSYALAEGLIAVAQDDARMLDRCRVTRPIAQQLYRAVGSVAANIAEGYSRGSGRDRARLFEYALGSVRESTDWYELARPVLGTVAGERLSVLTEIRRLLLATIPRERHRTLGGTQTKSGRPEEPVSPRKSAVRS